MKPRARHGSDAGYQHHRALGQRPCTPCCDAHAVTNANSRAWLRSRRGPDEPLRYAAAKAGREPAEALTTADRHRLVAELAARGWSTTHIAEHTRQTAYTTARIRDALALAEADHLGLLFLGRAQDRVAAHAQTTLDRLAQRDRERRSA